MVLIIATAELLTASSPSVSGWKLHSKGRKEEAVKKKKQKQTKL